MTTNKLTIAFPCQVVTMPPLALTESGQQIVDQSVFLSIPATDGTEFLILFREQRLLEDFACERLADYDFRPLTIDCPEQLQFVIEMTSNRLNAPIGLLVDPYPNLIGYSISPSALAKLLGE